MTEPVRKRRVMKAKGATVTATTRISPDLIRVSFDSPEITGAELAFTDHYVKLLFTPENADYSWPFDLMEIRETKPRELHPVTRTYTLCNVDTVAGTFDIDFVAHGTEGLAGPWAQQAQPGDQIGYNGPGGAWKPESDYEHFVLAGDEAAAPAIVEALKGLPAGTTATAYIEIASAEARFDVPTSAEVIWVYREGAVHGAQLIEAVRAGGYPEKKTSWFIHGVAEMVKETRRFLFVDGEVEKQDASISGYWRLGLTEDQWQSSKREFSAAMEAEEAAAQQS